MLSNRQQRLTSNRSSINDHSQDLSLLMRWLSRLNRGCLCNRLAAAATAALAAPALCPFAGSCAAGCCVTPSIVADVVSSSSLRCCFLCTAAAIPPALAVCCWSQVSSTEGRVRGLIAVNYPVMYHKHHRTDLSLAMDNIAALLGNQDPATV